MPELLEVEAYRQLSRAALGRPIVAVHAPDPWYLKGGIGARAVSSALRGRRLGADRRVGKLLLLDVEDGPTLGLRFGMTGVLEVDGIEGVDQLEYASRARPDGWIRFSLRFDDGGQLQVRDARRLGGVELDPDESLLGPDAAALTLAGLRAALDGARAPLKVRLMDQRRVAGLGNLLTDELLWRSGLDPARPAGELTTAEVRRLHRHLRGTLAELEERGGSHTGDLQVARRRGASCPRDGHPLQRRTIGGRTTYSCPSHQR
ncbi:MAG: hypothetical protein MUF83_22600 [Acidimicrobiales bacterium]|nr:hypothetical protein [Acidimicrobiales bacterium]